MKNYISNFFSVAISNFLPFIVMLLTLHFFGIEERGFFAVSTGYASMLGIFFSFSVGRSIVHLIKASGLDPREYFKENNISMMIFFSVLTFIALSILAFVGKYLSFLLNGVPQDVFFILCLMCPYYIWQYWGRFMYSSSRLLGLLNFIVVISRALIILCLISYCVFYKAKSFMGFCKIFSFFMFSSVILEYLVFVQTLGRSSGNIFSAIKKVFSWFKTINFPVHIDTIFSFMMLNINVLVVNVFLGSYFAGIFSVASVVTTLIYLISYTCQVMLQSKFLQPDFVKKDLDNIIKFVGVWSLSAVVVVEVLGCISLLLVKEKGHILIIKAIMILTPTSLIMCQNGILRSYFVSVSLAPKLLKITIYATAINFIIGLPLVFLTQFIGIFIVTYLVLIFVFIRLQIMYRVM